MFPPRMQSSSTRLCFISAATGGNHGEATDLPRPLAPGRLASNVARTAASTFVGDQGGERELPETGNYHMGVSENRGTPKWMVYNGKPY